MTRTNKNKKKYFIYINNLDPYMTKFEIDKIQTIKTNLENYSFTLFYVDPDKRRSIDFDNLNEKDVTIIVDDETFNISHVSLKEFKEVLNKIINKFIKL